MESAIPLAPLLLRNILLPLFIYTDKHLLNLTHKFKPFEILRYTLINVFVFFLKIIPNFIPNFVPSSLNPNSDFSDSDSDSSGIWVPFLKGAGKCNETADNNLAGDTCIARALSQLLSIVNEIPVSSRKYDIVRSYAEKLMDENLEEGYESLRKVNATVLSGAFSRALRQLELLAAAGAVEATEEDGEASGGGGDVVRKSGGGYFGLNRVFKTVGRYGDAAWTRFVKRKSRVGGSAEKLSAELLWLAQKLAACGSVDEAVRQWASATKLASSALSAQLRLQGSLVKLSVFLFKQATGMGGEGDDEGTAEELRKIKMTMLMSWLPFICRASNGTDTPVLNFHEKVELESVLGELIGSLKHEEEQEKVLALWLHHFTHCQSTDWPNLYLYYTRWCATSRKLLILEGR